MKILGISPFITHDVAACLLVDGKIVAAAEEERFSRKKHAFDQWPYQAAKFCLEKGGIKPQALDGVAYGWSPREYHRWRWPYIKRTYQSYPTKAFKALLKDRRLIKSIRSNITRFLTDLGVETKKLFYVPHHLAHAASAYYFSPFKEAAILSIDGAGERLATLIGYGRGGKIFPLKEIIFPDSLGFFYSAFTEFLGFKKNDGEYKVMGMAPYGKADQVNLAQIISFDKEDYHINDQYLWGPRGKRCPSNPNLTKKLIETFGEPRKGDDLSSPYIHLSAGVQEKLEQAVINLVEKYLADILKETGRLCFAGGVALNVSLNRKLMEHPLIKELWVQPASHDSGTALGAAAYLANGFGERIESLENVYLGPDYRDQEIEEVLKKEGLKFEKIENIEEKVAQLLFQEEIVGWFQGRMEFGPRALGNRSILANPAIKGIANKINEKIKFREKWRPFCPAILKEKAFDIVTHQHPSPFMTFSFKAKDEWRRKISEVIHVDGTLRPQFVEEISNPKFHKLLKLFYQKTGLPVLLNTSLNRRGEPMVCSPQDAIEMFKGSGLSYLVLGDFLIQK